MSRRLMLLLRGIKHLSRSQMPARNFQIRTTLPSQDPMSTTVESSPLKLTELVSTHIVNLFREILEAGQGGDRHTSPALHPMALSLGLVAECEHAAQTLAVAFRNRSKCFLMTPFPSLPIPSSRYSLGHATLQRPLAKVPKDYGHATNVSVYGRALPPLGPSHLRVQAHNIY